MISKVGFMQGRLSPVIKGKIQSFPWNTWQKEIITAKKIGFNFMEWTLDQDDLYKNPLMTKEGQKLINIICKKNNFSIPSLTGDCFMQAPFWKSQNTRERNNLKNDFKQVLISCSNVDINLVVIPLVDNGSLDNKEQEDYLINFLLEQVEMTSKLGIKIVFESDYGPLELSKFISRLDSLNFGINYDIGNSAALGFDPVEEFQAIGNRILNIHIKDRYINGETVELGLGNANFSLVFEQLRLQKYNSNYILQTARATNSQSHSEILLKYKNFVEFWLKKNEA